MSFQVVDLPPRAHLCKVKTLNRGDANSEVTVYYQVGTRTSGAGLEQNLGSSPSSVCSVGPEEPQRTRSDGADGGEFPQVMVGPEIKARQSKIRVRFLCGSAPRCTWRSRASTSSGPKRLWGRWLLPPPGALPSRSSQVVLLRSQVPGVPQLQEHLRAAGLLRHRGNAGHQVQVAVVSLVPHVGRTPPPSLTFPPGVAPAAPSWWRRRSRSSWSTLASGCPA